MREIRFVIGYFPKKQKRKENKKVCVCVCFVCSCGLFRLFLDWKRVLVVFFGEGGWGGGRVVRREVVGR